MRPTPSPERLALIDVLRGAAVLGVIVPNILDMGGWNQLCEAGLAPPPGTLDRIALAVTSIGFTGKMYPLLALLFGAGVAMQHSHLAREGRASRVFLWRRLMWLGVLGLAHATLLWTGDILLAYALLGLLLTRWWLDRDAAWLARRGVWLVAAALFIWMAIALALYVVALANPRLLRGEPPEPVWRTGSYLAVTQARLFEAPFALLVPLLSFDVLGAMCVGAAMAKLHVFAEVSRWSDRALTRMLVASIGIVAPLAVLAWWLAGARGAYAALDTAQLLAFGVGLAWLVPLWFAWLAFGALLVRKTPHIAHVLRQVGRVSLTIYVMQSLVATTLFYGYGFGLFGTFGPAALLGVALAIDAALIAFALVWLRRFNAGPLEWLWRRLSYSAS